jgi:uncharacterized protein
MSISTVDRLRELVRGTGVAGRSAAPVRELIYEPVDASGLPLPRRDDLPDLPGASYVDTPYGRAIVVDHVFEPDSFHGRVRLERAALAASTARALADGLAPALIDAASESSPVFLDLETTGLSGGAGTVAFLVGVGWFDNGAFRTRQFLLHGFAAERIFLAAVSDVLEAAPVLVTYNGKTFDLPVMETRWLFHRLDLPWDATPHLDMLHLARRLWRSRAERMSDPGCRLATLERDLFAVDRTDDCAGFEIPARYFAYIRRGDARLLAPVLHHNRLDLLSLACLTARAATLMAEGVDAACDADERLALGREYLRMGAFDRAERCLRAVVTVPHAPRITCVEAVFWLARLLRRQHRHLEAREYWQVLATTGWAKAGIRYEAQRALAVHHEHRERDLDAAHVWARHALDTASLRERREVAHRMARLERKRAGRRPAGIGTLLMDAQAKP